MKTYMELSLLGDKPAFDRFKNEVRKYTFGDWEFTQNNRLLKDYILFDYFGEELPHAEVSIIYGDDTWRQGYISVTNIVPIEKSQLSIDEYNDVLKLFYEDIIKPYVDDHPEMSIVGPTDDLFDPLSCITQKALDKLILFCDWANKSTGSSHPADEERWLDFICQTVDDNREFNYSTIRNFLMDEEYWGKRPEGYKGAIGRFAWEEDKAEELAYEYELYTRVIKYYKRTRNR